jgi:hypothetical protein
VSVEVMPTVERWELQARCVGHQHEVFANQVSFDRASDSDIRLRRARRLCVQCPVKTPCLTRALGGQMGYDPLSEILSWSSPEPVTGVWAGTTRSEREAVAGLPVHRQIAVLLTQFREKALAGEYRVAVASEWVE